MQPQSEQSQRVEISPIVRQVPTGTIPSRLIVHRHVEAAGNEFDTAVGRPANTMELRVIRDYKKLADMAPPSTEASSSLFFPELPFNSIDAPKEPHHEMGLPEHLELIFCQGNWWAVAGADRFRVDPDLVLKLASFGLQSETSIENLIGLDESRLGPLAEAGIFAPRATPTGRQFTHRAFSADLAPLQARHKAEALKAQLDGRIPVLSPYGGSHWSPPMALYNLIAQARFHNDGQLQDRYALISPTPCDSRSFQELIDGLDRAVVLLSHYEWTKENLVFARLARRHLNESVIIWGGPSVPKYEEDLKKFWSNPRIEADIAVHGEGEVTFCELLSILRDTETLKPQDADLGSVAGISFSTNGGHNRNPDRARIQDLAVLRSPLLDGTFDLDGGMVHALTLEFSRGCPYGCTFCDWGSATNSRIRNFPLERSYAELDELARRRVEVLLVADSNLGIHARDVDIVRWAAKAHLATGYPSTIISNYAKNTTKHLAEIFDTVEDAGMSMLASVSLQTIDPTTLDAVARKNIRLEKYEELTRDLRERGKPVGTDLMIGLPGQTLESFKADLQMGFDLCIIPTIYRTRLLPNSPMNDPEYRKEWEIQIDSQSRVTSTRTASPAEIKSMTHLAALIRALEERPFARYLIRYAEDTSMRGAADLLHDLEIALWEDPEQFPHLADYIALLPAAPGVYWRKDPILNDLRKVAIKIWGVPEDSATQTVLDATSALLREHRTHQPTTINLDHDIVGWFAAHLRSSTRSFMAPAEKTFPRLREFPPSIFEVKELPAHLQTDAGEVVHLTELDNPLRTMFTVPKPVVTHMAGL